MEALRVENLSKNFGGVQAIRNVSFSVEAGQRLGIIGPNGAGKTTLFNLLNGQLLPSAGRIYFFGREITTMATHHRTRLGQARSFQISSLFFNLTVLKNILLALHGTRPSGFQMFRAITAYKHQLTKAEELLGAMDLWKKRDLLVKNLSHGEQRKMEIAFTLALEPKMLLLDEPSAGLTTVESDDVIGIIHSQGADITVLIIAHDIDLIFSVADRIMVIHYGQIIAEGKPEEIQADLRVKEVYMGIE